jgi:Carboxypeptidase regulatory-like domain
MPEDKGIISGRVTDNADNPIYKAEVVITLTKSYEAGISNEDSTFQTEHDGSFRSSALYPGIYKVTAYAFGKFSASQENQNVGAGCVCDVPIKMTHLSFAIVPDSETTPVVGTRFGVHLEAGAGSDLARDEWHASPDARSGESDKQTAQFLAFRPGRITITHRAVGIGTTAGKGSQAEVNSSTDVLVDDAPLQRVGGNVNVALSRAAVYRTEDQALWVAIRNRTHAISFNRYREFLDRVLGIVEEKPPDIPRVRRRMDELDTHLHGVAAYNILKIATEAFLLIEAGVYIRRSEFGEPLFNEDAESNRLGQLVEIEDLEERLSRYLGHPRQLPYIKRVVRAAFSKTDPSPVFRDRVLTARLDEPILLELIWSYWHEEGMLMQTINAIARRFQNVRAPGDRDPLAYLEIDPLRPLNNVLWGFIQDEPNRLTVTRRAYEYEHSYGLSLFGKAVHSVHPAESRSKFVEAFHNLLHLSSVFYKEDNDTTVIADGYPLLNALKEVHLLLAQGAHNQFGDLGWTARVEMLLAEWMLARPEMRDFIQARVMVPYKEPWMPQVDTMKTLQGWTDVTVTHFRDLGTYGEQILLAVRYGDWIGINDEDYAKNWARYWRPEIQGYLHAYRAVTGIDLTNPDTVDATVPAIHLQKRLAIQQRVR